MYVLKSNFPFHKVIIICIGTLKLIAISTTTTTTTNNIKSTGSHRTSDKIDHNHTGQIHFFKLHIIQSGSKKNAMKLND